MEGWIKLHRKIQDHWIWQDDKYFKWWSIILLNVNHSESKFPVGDELMLCKPGESFKSIETWTSLFSCSKKTTVKFFLLLKNDDMISTKIVGKGNRRKHLLTVANWMDYQVEETELGVGVVPKTPLKEYPNVPPNKNDKKEKNEKECLLRSEKFKIESLKLKDIYGEDMIDDFVRYWTEPNKSKTKLKFELQKTFEISRRLVTWNKNNFNSNAKTEQNLTPAEQQVAANMQDLEFRIKESTRKRQESSAT